MASVIGRIGIASRLSRHTVAAAHRVVSGTQCLPRVGRGGGASTVVRIQSNRPSVRFVHRSNNPVAARYTFNQRRPSASQPGSPNRPQEPLSPQPPAQDGYPEIYRLSPAELWAKANEQRAINAPRPPLTSRLKESLLSSSRVRLIGLLAGGLGLYVVIHLERVPETGRLRFLDTSVKTEHEMANEAFEQALQQYRGRILPSSDARVQLVRRVASRLLKAANDHQYTGMIKGKHLPSGLAHGAQHHDHSHHTDDPQTNWQVFVIQSNEQNAFVLPNGKIFVFTGILPICKDEDGLATVLGHEIAHQIARHGGEKVSQSRLTFALGLLGEFILPGTFHLSNSSLMLLKDLPNSRGVESEADRIGLWLMSAACYDPAKAPLVWQRMREMEKQNERADDSLEWAQTHPLSEKRMKSLQSWQEEALQIRQRNNCPSTTVEQSRVFRSSIREAINPPSFQYR